MKYSITINQKFFETYKLKNINQAAILDLLITSSTWAEPIMIENELYFWVSRQKISEELKSFKLASDTIYRHLKYLSENQFIIYKKQGRKDCVKLTDKGKKYAFDKLGNKSDFEPNSEINPSKLGNKSELNSEINPTYNNTNINNNTNNKKSIFRNSIYHDYDTLRNYFLNKKEYVKKYAGADLKYYIEQVEIWSDKKGKLTTNRGWLAYIRQFMNSDLENDKLYLKKKSAKTDTEKLKQLRKEGRHVNF